MTSPVSIRNIKPGAVPDSRSGLGYGQLEPKHHLSRQSQGSYPYEDPDEHEDVDISDIDPEVQKKLRTVINGYLANDFLDVKGTDPFYYAAGNTNMAALGEATGTSIAPFPGMYKKRMQVGGGVGSPKAFSPGSLQQTGGTIGYSHPHRSLGADNEMDIFQYDDENGDEELPIKKVRMVIRNILEKE